MADAEAICEAVSRPNMRFVPIKNIEQQAILSIGVSIKKRNNQKSRQAHML